MKAISNALKGVTYHNPQWGESLYELCRRATSRHIDRPDEIINQQVVYMINSEMHAPFAAKDACTCLKRRLQMDHPQKQYLAIILTSKVLQDCHAALGPYQGELLQEVAYILRTVRSSSPAAARTRQVAMDVLRHFGSAGGDAYRVARQQQGGVAPVGARVDNVNRDPAAVAAERASLLDEIKRMVEQASASTEILNELILNKEQPGGGAAAGAAGSASESVGLRKELLADVAELRRLFDLYMGQLANLSGPDAEAAMKAALEAVDQLDGALSLEKDVDAELKDLASKGQLPPPPAAAEPDATAADGASSSAAAATAAAADEAAARVQSVNLIDLDDEPTPAAPAAAAAPAAGPIDPFAPPVPPPAAAAAAGAALDPFAPAAAASVPDPFAPAAAAAADPADPFAALAAAPLTGAPAAQQTQPYPQQAVQQFPQPSAAADPFAEPGPAWGAAPGSSTPAAAGPYPCSLPQQQSGGGLSAGVASGGGAGSLPTSGGGSSSAGPTGGGAMPGALGGFMAAAPAAAAAAAASPYGGAPVTPGYGGGFMAPPGQGMPGQGMPGQGMMGAPYGYGMQPMQQQMPSPYGMPSPYAGMTGGAPMYMAQPTGGPNPYGQPMMPPATAAYPGLPSPYPSPYPQQQPQMPQQMPQQQQQPGAFGGLPAVQAPAGGGAADQAVLSPTNPFASVAPVSAVGGGVPNPFQSPAGSAGGAAAANVEQEWNTFFSDRPGMAAAK